MKRSVDLDVSAIEDVEQLHALLHEKLGFPVYYGGNWDAFDECIRDSSLRLPDQIRVRGMKALSAKLPKDERLFRECASDASAIPAFDWLS